MVFYAIHAAKEHRRKIRTEFYNKVLDKFEDGEIITREKLEKAFEEVMNGRI